MHFVSSILSFNYLPGFQATFVAVLFLSLLLNLAAMKAIVSLIESIVIEQKKT